MVLPQPIPIEGQDAIATFPFTDIKSGTGFTTYQAAHIWDNAGIANYALSEQALFSSSGSTVHFASIQQAFVKFLDLDFDLSEFKFPQDVKGDLTATVTHSVASNSEVNSANQYVLVRMKRVRGGAETEIGFASGAIQTSPNHDPPGESPTIKTFTETVNIPIPTLEHFKKGDILRATVQTWVRTSNGTNTPFSRIYHDPQNRDIPSVPFIVGTSGVATSQLIINTPFNLDIS